MQEQQLYLTPDWEVKPNLQGNTEAKMIGVQATRNNVRVKNVGGSQLKENIIYFSVTPA